MTVKNGVYLFATTAIGLLLISSVIQLVAASSGDRDSIYINCAHKCRRSCLTENPDPSLLPTKLERLLFWDCPQNCQYNCMHWATSLYKANHEPVLQYYGKWPFIRLWGMQEPASVLFSLGNLWMHWNGYRALRKAIPRWFENRAIYRLNALLGVNTWLWSAVFHTRDFPLTEKLDYFSAMGGILFGLYLAIVRVFQLRSGSVRTALGALAAMFFAGHVAYLSLWKFDYRYNMMAGVAVGMLGNLCWVGWGLAEWKRGYTWKILLSVILISTAMSLELLDFPPLWGVLDAHALWHAATIPLVKLWYSFVLDDIRWEVRKGKGKGRLEE
ncbi:hypothetical protein HDU85_006100 [Gaertneriomyces sp. JEL0708]|nr:hypothetical protein HDU85_006100 [Gaertneriomyces sp. JEL0708]